MSKVRNAEKIKKRLKQRLQQKKEDTVEHVLAYLVGKLLTHQPTEDGHAHEAWLVAIDGVEKQYPTVSRVAAHHDSKRSNDPTAKKYGESSVSQEKQRTTVVISNNLPFVKKIEYGIPITVGDESGNQGKKINPVKRPPEKGPLYGQRQGGSEGLLVFEQGGRIIKTKSHVSPHAGFLKRTIEETIQYAKSKGLKVKRRK